MPELKSKNLKKEGRETKGKLTGIFDPLQVPSVFEIFSQTAPKQINKPEISIWILE